VEGGGLSIRTPKQTILRMLPHSSVTWLFMEALKGAFLYIFVLTFYVQLVHLHSIKHITSKQNKALVKLFGQDT